MGQVLLGILVGLTLYLSKDVIVREKVLLENVDSISDLVESFKDCLGDLEDFEADGYEIFQAHLLGSLDDPSGDMLRAVAQFGSAHVR